MREKITCEEMIIKYSDEWLLIIDFETDKSGHLLSGVIERHSPDMNEITKLPLIKKQTAFRYTGQSSFMGIRSYEHCCNNL